LIVVDPTFRHLIGQAFTLDQIASAHQAVEDGRILGNAIISLG
jgi:hypothetical protein